MPDPDKTTSLSLTIPELQERVALLEAALHEQKQAEAERLRESESLYRSILKASPDIIAITDLEGHVRMVSPSALAMFGYTQEHELLGHLIIEFLVSDDHERAQSNIAFMHQGIFTGPAEYLGVRADGSLFDIEANAEFIRDRAGQPTGMVFIIRDITGRKRAEMALHKSEQRYNYLAETALETILVHDLDGRITYVNKACLRLFESSEDVLLGRDIEDFISADSKYALHERQTRRLQGEQTRYLFECEVIKPNGKKVSVEVSSTLIEGNTGGKQVLVVARDITERKRAEIALKESEERFRLTFYTSPDSININRLEDGLYVDINEGFTRITGYTREDIIGKTSLELNIWYNPEDRQEMVRRVKETGYCENFETHFRKKDGSTIIGLFSARVISLNDVPHLISITRDITQRKQVEERLQENQALYQSILKASPENISITDMEGRIRMTSPAGVNMFGFSREEEVLDHFLTEFLVPEDLGRAQSAIMRVLQGVFTGTEEFRGVRADGSAFNIESSGELIRDNAGQPIGMVIISRDITERKRAEAERERLMAAIEQTGEVIFITDSKGFIQYVNPAFERVTGYSRDEALGQNPRFLKSGEQDGAFYSAMWKTLIEGRTWQGRFINKRKDGTRYTEIAAISPVRDASGTTVSYVTVKRDISHELETEQQLLQAQKMESVGRLAGGVAHDFNNLLMAIMGYTELCLDGLPDNHPTRKWLNEITNNVERSANLIRQLLAFARKQTIIPKMLDLNETVASMLKLLRRLIGENIDLAWLPGMGLWPVKLDTSQVDQILVNLSVNARDAINGVGKVMIETRNVTLDTDYCVTHAGEAVPGEYVQISFSDNGCGMEKDILEHIFDPFFTTKDFGKGTGMGLSTVYGIVKQNNGFITVYSEPSEGTTFKIYLPRFTGETERVSDTREKTLPRGQGETVLLVEDEQPLRIACERLLDSLGYKVRVAATPAEALELVAQYPDDINLLLTDVVMPCMSGRELAEKISVLKQDLKVLYMSGYTADVIGHHGILDEDVHFISKPFSRDELARKLKSVLETE